MVSTSDTKQRNGVCLYDSETVVFEKDGWGIITDNCTNEFRNNKGSTYATHRCVFEDEEHEKTVYGEYCWIDDQNLTKKAVCLQCSEDVPDSIVTLIRIHNWKR